ncbi:MAG: helix-turn-helix domain-containing protein [Candidatus Neptunochlamydia sp.]|nr:helix-turn-helix domain-containing protein [Candidatus Neptunochlamydia sp.]
MTTKELRKLEVLMLVKRGKIKTRERVEELRITKRHFRRLIRRHEEEGAGGIAHRSRGKKSRKLFPTANGT